MWSEWYCEPPRLTPRCDWRRTMARPSACGIIKLFATGPSLHHRALFAVPSVMSTNPLAMCCATRRPGVPLHHCTSFPSCRIQSFALCATVRSRVSPSPCARRSLFSFRYRHNGDSGLSFAQVRLIVVHLFTAHGPKTQPCRLQHSPKGLSNRKSRLPKRYDTPTMETDTRCKRSKGPSTGSGRVRRPTGRKCHS